ncbi:glycerate kinase, partial [Latilactobacillus sakei subsp. sakei]
MKIVLAPDSFKNSVTAIEASHAMRAGFEKVF